MIAGSETVRAHSLGKREGPLKLARVYRERVSVSLPRSDFAFTFDHQLAADDQNLDIARINPRKGNPADQLVPLHRDFYLRVPTARPQPAGEQPLPTTEEAVE